MFAHVCLATQIVLEEQLANGAVVELMQMDEFENIHLVNVTIVNNFDSLRGGQYQPMLAALLTVSKFALIIPQHTFFIFLILLILSWDI